MPLVLNNYALQQVKFKCLLYVFINLSLVEFPFKFWLWSLLKKLWMAPANLLTQNDYGNNFDSDGILSQYFAERNSIFFPYKNKSLIISFGLENLHFCWMLKIILKWFLPSGHLFWINPIALSSFWIALWWKEQPRHNLYLRLQSLMDDGRNAVGRSVARLPRNQTIFNIKRWFAG